jgi:cell division septation protein DedD
VVQVIHRRKFGMVPSPAWKQAAAPRHKTLHAGAVPANFGYNVPSQLNLFGNDSYGDCVTAEECFKLATYSTLNNLPEVYVPYDTAVAWAKEYGFLNGADLTDVMTQMADTGITIGTTTYKDGPYQSVDWTNWDNLTSAISQGQVKIGVAGDPLEGVVGSTNGWIGFGLSGWIQNHCVGLPYYGTLAFLCALFNVPVPTTHDPTTQCVALSTWGTIGIIDFAGSLQGLCSEAWLRTPSTVGEGPITPTPPAPTPTPPAPTPTPPAPTPTPPTPTPTPTSIVVPAGFVLSGSATFNPGPTK